MAYAYNLLITFLKGDLIMNRKLVACISAIAIAASLVLGACGGSSAPATTAAPADTTGASADTTAAPADTTAAPAETEGTGEAAGYTFGTNIWGSGSYVLESQVKTADINFAGTGMVIKSISNDFTADKLVQDAQTLISDGVDAVLYSCNAQPTFIPIAQICEQNKVPFVYYDKLPADQAVQDQLDQMEYYVGNIVCDNYDFGYQIGEICLKDGNKTALIVRAAAGDDSHDGREKGFREAFEAGGGTVLGVTNCADPSEAVTKSNDIITAYPDADCIYAVGTDFAIGTLNAIESRSDDYSKNMKVYTSDFTPDAARDVLAGKLAALNGGQLEESTIAAILAANWLDGHPILTPEGGKPLFNQMKPVLIDAENAQGFIDKTEAGEPIIPQEEYQKLMYRYNPDVDYDTFVEFLTNYADTYAAGIVR